MKETYTAWAYVGVFELMNLGTFDLFDEAQDALVEAHNKYCEDDSDSEIFWFNSRLVKNNNLAIKPINKGEK